MRISVVEAEGQLAELVRRAKAGDDVVLTTEGESAVRLVPITEKPKASEAERLYWESQLDSVRQDVYATIRVHHGKAALENVMINDRPITDIVREMNSKAE